MSVKMMFAAVKAITFQAMMGLKVMITWKKN